MGKVTVQSNRRTKYIAASLSVTAILLTTPADAADTNQLEQGRNAPVQAFHVASTEAERTLDAILALRDDNGSLYEFLTNREGGRENHYKIFFPYFTSELLNSISAAEKKLVKLNCNGKYIDGDLCGIEYNPLNCAQDTPSNGYYYRTEHFNDKEILSQHLG